MNRSFPNVRSIVSLMGVVFAASVYISNDTGVSIDGSAGMFWLLRVVAVAALQMTVRNISPKISP